MIAPLEEKELKPFAFFFKAVKESMGFVPSSMKTMARVPAIMGAFSILSGTVLGDPSKAKPSLFLKLVFRQLGWSGKYMKSDDRIPMELRHMVSYVSSRAAGCQYCQAHTFAHLAHDTTNMAKMEKIWEFESSELFTDAEKSALRFGIAAGSTPNAVTKEHFEDLRKYYSENQIVELGGVIALFGFLNRWNETFSTQLEEKPLEVANQYLKKGGWDVGRHG